MSPDVALMWLSVASAFYKRSLGRNVVVLESTGCAEGCWDFDLAWKAIVLQICIQSAVGFL